MVTLSDISKALAEAREDMKVVDIMTKNIITVDENVMIADARSDEQKPYWPLNSSYKTGKAQGIVTRTDLLDKIAGLQINFTQLIIKSQPLFCFYLPSFLQIIIS